MWIAVPVFLIVAIITAFATGILRFQQRTSEQQPSADTSPFQLSVTPEQEPEELVDLVDYYADHKEAEPEAKKPEPPRMLERDEQYDRLSNFKVGRGYLVDCQNLLHAVSESGQKFVLVYFDFNRFRYVNTMRGFSTGDYVLTRVSHDTRDLLPDGAIATRLSADHFTVLMLYIDEAQLQTFHEQLKRIAERVRGDVGAKSGMQVCMGVAITESPSDYDIFKLIRRANIARHSNKASKGESYALFDISMLSSYLYGESALDDYKEHQYSDDFTLYLRPQLFLSSKRIVTCDTMVRWACEDINSLIPVADGTILPNSNLKVIYQVCRTINRWRKAGHIPLPATVGVGEIDFFKEDLDAFFVRCLGEFQLDPSMLSVSVSIHCIRLDYELAKLQMQKLSDVGMKVLVCDIDRGLRTVDMLEGIHVDFLKLHKSFARDLENMVEREQDVERIVAMAKTLGAGTVFEGVDNATCLNMLVSKGGTYAQGRYVGASNNIEGFTEDMSSFMKGIAKDPSDATVILDDETMQKGNYHLF